MLVPGRLRQENFPKLEANLDYTVNSRAAWDTMLETLAKKQTNKKTVGENQLQTQRFLSQFRFDMLP